MLGILHPKTWSLFKWSKETTFLCLDSGVRGCEVWHCGHILLPQGGCVELPRDHYMGPEGEAKPAGSMHLEGNKPSPGDVIWVTHYFSSLKAVVINTGLGGPFSWLRPCVPLLESGMLMCHGPIFTNANQGNVSGPGNVRSQVWDFHRLHGTRLPISLDCLVCCRGE